MVHHVPHVELGHGLFRALEVLLGVILVGCSLWLLCYAVWLEPFAV